MDIAAWLGGLGLEQYAPVFRDNGIDMQVLPKLTAEDLKDLGITMVGHRRILLEAIAALREPAPRPAPASGARSRPQPGEFPLPPIFLSSIRPSPALR